MNTEKLQDRGNRELQKRKKWHRITAFGNIEVCSGKLNSNSREYLEIIRII